MQDQGLKRPKKVRGEFSAILISQKKDDRMPHYFHVRFIISDMSNPAFIQFKWKNIGYSKRYKFFHPSEKRLSIFFEDLSFEISAKTKIPLFVL